MQENRIDYRESLLIKVSWVLVSAIYSVTSNGHPISRVGRDIQQVIKIKKCYIFTFIEFTDIVGDDERG